MQSSICRYALCGPTVMMLCLSMALPSANAEDEVDYFSLSLEELMQVKVTAQKREQNAEDVPESLATLSGDALDVLNSSGMDVRQLSARVPSLLIESSFGRTFPRFYLRGMGNTDFDLISSQPVSLVLDEVVLENSLLKGFPLFDLDRVEVLRGPQGTLFGRNTTAGTVKFESRKPVHEQQFYGNFGYGSFASNNIEVMANAPLNQAFAVRVSLLRQTRDNWIDNAAPGFEKNNQLGGYDDNAGRLQMRYQPDEKLDVLLNTHFRNATANSRVFVANSIAKGDDELVAGFDPDTVYQDAASRNEQNIQLHGWNLRAQYNAGRYSWFYVGGSENADIFSRGDIDGGYGACFLVAVPVGENPCDQNRYGAYEIGNTMGPGFIPFPSETGVGMPEHHQITHEIRLASNELGRFDYQLGAFWFDEDLTIENYSYNTLAAGVQNGLSIQNMQTTSWAVFGSFDYDISDHLNGVIGARYSADKRAWHGDLLQSPNGGLPFGSDAAVDDGQWSWDASALYQLTDATNMYARIAKGYRAPSIQGRNLLFSAQPTTADAETLISYEGGFKSDFLQNRARLNGSLFYYTAHGQQLTAVGGGNNVAKLINANKTVGYGFELESELALSRAFLLSAGVSYNHTELNDPGLAVAICASNCTVQDPTITDPQNPAKRLALIDGNPLPQSPKWIANVNARYNWALGTGEFFIYTDWAYHSRVNFFLYEAKEYTSEFMLEGGLRIGYDWNRARHRYEWALFGRNITDQTRLEGGIDFNNRTGYLNEPRYWGLEFKAKFF